MKRLLLVRCASLAAAVLFGGLVAMPAYGAPKDTRITAVFQGPCAGATCKSGTDSALDNNDVARSAVQVQMASSSSVGLDSARLEMRYGSGAWMCVKTWTVGGGRAFSAHYDWETRFLPKDCSGEGGSALSRNGTYAFRLIAAERVSGDTQTSPVFTIRVENPPEAPEWTASPKVTGASEYSPLVELSWRANSEPDVVEYHYARLSPNGTEDEFAVSAAHPGGQGCDISGDIYTCWDDYFPSKGFGGTYTYVLIAYRSSPATSGQCALPPGGKCVQSSASEPKNASVVEPKPSPTAVPTPTKSSSAATATAKPRPSTRVLGTRTNWKDYYTGEYEEKLPYAPRTKIEPVPGSSRFDSGTALAAAPESSEGDSRNAWLSIAAGLVMILTALHLTRALRRT
ncbi:MAG: hypothetical protein WDA27_14555 [Actinomycetota bacterium]